jgi:hypothetical protein
MTDRMITITRDAWYAAHSHCPTCGHPVTVSMEVFLPCTPFCDTVNTGTCQNEACLWSGPIANAIPEALPAQVRQAKKQMIPRLMAAHACLGLRTKDAVMKAIQVIDQLPRDDIRHAIVWLGGAEATKAGIQEEDVDKLVSICESVLRVRPKVIKEIRDRHAAKTKAQAEN